MAAIYWVAATLIGLVVGLVSGVLLIIEYIGYAIGVGATVIASQVAHALPRQRTAS